MHEPGPVLISRSFFLDEEAATAAVVICHQQGPRVFVYCGHFGSRDLAFSGFLVFFAVDCTCKHGARVAVSAEKRGSHSRRCDLPYQPQTPPAISGACTEQNKNRQNGTDTPGPRHEPRSDTGPLPGGRPALLGIRGVPRLRVPRGVPRLRVHDRAKENEQEPRATGRSCGSPIAQVARCCKRATGHRAPWCCAVFPSVLLCLPAYARLAAPDTRFQ